MTATGNPAGLLEMVGRVFSGRYRVDELIGIGAVTAVYTAYDSVEGRWVALKLFEESFAADDALVARLLDAVEQAATLSHPNMVEIFDWGVDGGPYIASELCDGGSLATLLAAGHRLDASQALVMTLECTRALSHGHDQGVVHRNLHPRNILFSADHHVRISDYGLAAVLADAPTPNPSSALESVRYSSPEQARGRPVGEQSDVYSLALIASEAVSGIAPVVAETVVGTLMARAESTAELDPALQGLLSPLERCGRVDAGERPEAGELSIALLAAAESMGRPAPLPVVGLTTPDNVEQAALRVAGGVVGDIDVPDIAAEANAPDALAPETDDDPLGPEVAEDDFDVSALGPLDDIADFSDDADTDFAHDDGPPPLELVETVVPTVALENLEEAEPVFAGEADSLVDTGANELDVPERAASNAADSYEQFEDDADDRLPWWPLVLLGLLVAGAVAASAYFFVLDGADEAALVPDLVGVPFDDAALQVEDRGWELVRLEGRVDGSEIGSVVSQSPSQGVELDQGEALTVTVSLGNEMVEIPSDIVGLTVEQAGSRLGSVGLGLGRLTEENSESLAAGLVVGLNEPTTQKPSGQGVALRVSAGAEDRFVPPEVIGMTIGDATTLLVEQRLQAVEEPTFSPDIEVGIVLGVLPEVGSIVPADSAITLFVSAGPEPVVMPDIVGLALDEAIDELEALGLIFADTQGTPGEDVIGSLPPIGATVDVGTEVLVYLDDPPEDEEEE